MADSLLCLPAGSRQEEAKAAIAEVEEVIELAPEHEAAIAPRTTEQKLEDLKAAHSGEMGARLKKVSAPRATRMGLCEQSTLALAHGCICRQCDRQSIAIADRRRCACAAQAKAKVGALTCSLMWHNGNDLDLHCQSPTGSHIFYAKRKVGVITTRHQHFTPPRPNDFE
eukprot:COSAG01_NODE_132_length_24759_cov_13.862298_14_plen_169_part_00